MVQRLVIGGTWSGVGKTTITVGLLAALRRRGLIVQPFKVGPDYIDPTYHTLAANRPCRNLDSWMMAPERVRALFRTACQEVDIAVVEGVMGVFDGLGYDDETGSTAQVAKLLKAPVVIVLDTSKMARSAAAVAMGYAQLDKELPLTGFIVNRAASARHGAGIAAAVEKATGLPVFGWLPRDQRLRIEERHLGLVPVTEPGPRNSFVEAAGEAVTRYLDLDRLLAITKAAPPLDSVPAHGAEARARNGKPAPVIAVARDDAFHFTYEENLELLRAAGAEIAFFSPLRDSSLPPGAGGIILSGGFPEMFTSRLAGNTGMHRALREAHRCDVPIYAECGGLMYLTEAIIDLEKRRHAMVGLLPGTSAMSGKVTLGYREARAAKESWLLEDGELVRGHEFHYSVWEDRPANLPPAYFVSAPSGEGDPRPEGACLGSLWASYVHLHFWGKPELAERFVEACCTRAVPIVG
jgi:cobyrinic acid a,c-diamide synthase